MRLIPKSRRHRLSPGAIEYLGLIDDKTRRLGLSMDNLATELACPRSNLRRSAPRKSLSATFASDGTDQNWSEIFLELADRERFYPANGRRDLRDRSLINTCRESCRKRRSIMEPRMFGKFSASKNGHFQRTSIENVFAIRVSNSLTKSYMSLA